jgi:hypothetical protein
MVLAKNEEVAALNAKIDAMSADLRNQEALLKEANDKQDVLLKTITAYEDKLSSAPKTKPLSSSPSSKSKPSSLPRIKEPDNEVKHEPLSPTYGMSVAERISHLKTAQEKKVEKADLRPAIAVGKLNERLRKAPTTDIPVQEDKSLANQTSIPAPPSSSSSASTQEKSGASIDQTDLLCAIDETRIATTRDVKAQFENEFSMHVDEINRLRRENSILRDQLERSRFMLRSHEEILQKIRSSAEELTFLEAEEIARLTAEVERLVNDNKQLKEKHGLQVQEIQRLSKRIIELERTPSINLIQHSDPPSSIKVTHRQRESTMMTNPVTNQDQLIEKYR